jgi:hypothetical protein
MRRFWNPLERFLRVVLAYGVCYGVAALLRGEVGVEIPAWIIPVAGAVLNALAKWFRDKWGVDIQL